MVYTERSYILKQTWVAFKKYVRHGRGRGSLKSERKRTEEFKQQTEFFLINYLAVPKCFAILSLVQHIKLFFYYKGVDIFFSFVVFL